MQDSCKDIAVDALKTGDFLITSCRLNRVYIKGDVHTVQVHSYVASVFISKHCIFNIVCM